MVDQTNRLGLNTYSQGESWDHTDTVDKFDELAIERDTVANRPASGDYDGELFLATDEEILYRWDGTNTTWVDALVGYDIALVDDTDSPYTTDDEDVIYANTANGAVTVTLASADATDGNAIRVVNVDGSNAVTVDTESTETIDPSAGSSKTISAAGWGVTFTSDGTNWDSSLSAEFAAVDASSEVKLPSFSDNANAVQESRSVWFNDGTGTDDIGYYAHDGSSVIGPFATDPLVSNLDAGGNNITNIGSVSINNVGGRGESNSAQTIANNSTTQVELDTTGFEHSSVVDVDTANDQLVIQEAGVYLISPSLSFSTNLGDGTNVSLVLQVNGNTVLETKFVMGGSAGVGIAGTTAKDLSANDTIRILVFQDSGSSADLQNDERVSLTAVKLG